ncbi:MAG: glycosyltransferase family 4 protein [Nodosilinea sp.]
MKITFIIPCLTISGGIRVIATHAKYLRDKGHDIVIVAPKPKNKSFLSWLKAFIKKRSFQPDSYSDSTYFEINQLSVNTSKTSAIQESDLPDSDFIIATWWETAEWISNFSDRKGKKIYFVQHHEIVIDHQHQNRVKATYRLPFPKITISQWLVDLMINEYGNNEKNVYLVPNSVDTNLFNAQARAKNHEPVIGFMYSDLTWKGSDICLGAIQLVRDQYPNVRVVAFSSVYSSSKIPLPTEVNITFRPPQNTIRNIYASCDVWLCGSRSEGFSLPILEAMACRCPVVSVSTGIAPEIIKPGINGFLAPVEDIETLAYYLLKVIQLTDLEWQLMSNAAYETAIGYTWDDAAHLLEEALMTSYPPANGVMTDRSPLSDATDPTV